MFHLDSGGEFVNDRLHIYLQNKGVLHQLNCPRTYRSVVELGMA